MSSPSDLASREVPPRVITVRSVLLGLAGVIALAVFVPYNDHALHNTLSVGSYFPFAVMMLMMVLVLLVNPVLVRIRPSAVLHTGELLVVWSMMLIGAGITGVGLLQPVIPWMVTPIYMLPEHPGWAEILDYLPDSLFISTDPDDAAVTDFVLGTPDEHGDVPWAAWRRPSLLWGAFYVPLFLGAIFLAVLIAPHWIRAEKLQFPVARVMLEMVEEPAPGRCYNKLLGHSMTWVGAGLPIFVHGLNGLHHYLPKVPGIDLYYNMNGVFTEGMWQHMIWYIKTGSIYFSMIGVAFLMSADVSLSLWVICLVCAVILALFRDQGIDTWLHMASQNYGAMLAMGLFLLYLARGHLAHVFRVTVRRTNDEIGFESVALVGLTICSVMTVGWLCWLGMPVWAAVLEVVIIYLLWLVLSRIVAETGMFFILQRFWSWYIFAVPTDGAISAKIQTLSVSTIWPIFYNRETMMVYMFTVMRFAWPTVQRVWRGLLILLFSSMIVSIIVGGVTYLKLYYQQGALQTNSWFAMVWPHSAIEWLEDYRRVPLEPGQSLNQVLIGAGIVVILGLCRIRFARWPFVPIAFCLATSDALGFMWPSILVGWLCKVTVMRTGGMSAYHKIRPVFMGLVIGEFLMVGIWMVVGAMVRACGLEYGGFHILPGV